MASTIRIKRSSTAGNPSTLGAGELAYSALSDNGSNGGDRLYIGMGTETTGNAANHVVIGGKFFTDRLDHTAGTLTASSAIVVDANSKIDNLLVDNLQLNGNVISSTNTDGNITLTPNGDGYVQISGTNALVIPKGTNAQQAPGVSGAVRFNTDNTAFEGYDGTNWASLGGVMSVDQLTYIKAEATAGDGTLYFNAKDGVTSKGVLTLDKDGLKILSTTTASGSNTGALQVAGGVSIEGALYVQGSLSTTGNQNSDAFLAAQGVPDNGTTGFSFQNDGGYDTGMFSAADGQLRLYSNDDAILQLQGTSTATLNVDTLLFGNITGGDRSAAQLGWNGLDNGIKFFTRYGSQETISPLTDGNYLLLQSTNTSGDANAGRSSLRWHDYDVSAYSQVDAQSDGVWIKNANWNGVSTVAQYWHFANDGKLTLPNIVNSASQYSSYAQLYQTNNNEITLNPDTDSDLARLNIASWLSNGNINLYNNGDRGLTLGNYDSGDSSIDIGGSGSSVYTETADDITISARRNGRINLYTNNNDIVLGNDYGQVTFRNADGHLVIPGVIETSATTGDVTLAASDGSEKNLVFKGDGSLALPNVGVDFYNSNNIGGNQVGQIRFDGSDFYIDNYNGSITLWANDSAGWQFNNTNGGQLQLPHGAVFSDGSNNSILLGYGVQQSGYSQRVVIGYQPDGQSGESWDAIAIGSRAGTTNQSNNAIAMGNRAGNSNQGADAIAIGSSPNSSVGGAGYSNQGQYAVAIGAQAGETSQAEYTIAIGAQAGQTNQGWKSIAIGEGAGNDSQQQWAVALGLNAGNSSQGNSTVAVGHSAGRTNQGSEAVAIGVCAGQSSQGAYAVALGSRAGYGDNTAQGQYSIAIGYHAGYSSQHDNSIILNASGNELNPSEAGLFIDPIRNVNAGSQFVIYNSDTKEVTYNATNIEIDGSVITATNATTDASVILEPLGAGYISASNAQIKNVAEPTADSDAATKYYVDAARSGLDVKQSVRLATTGNITLSGEQLIDTIMAVTGDRVLVKDQDDHTLNGIYIVSSDSWARATDFDTNSEVTSGAFTFVEDGSVNTNSGFVVTTKVIGIGTTAIDWTLFSASGTLIAGDGLVKSGYTLAVNTNSSTGGIEIADDALQLKSSLAGDGLTYTDGVLTVGGTADRITVGTHAIDIASSYAGQSSITTLGTISTGIWNGNTIGSAYGGTGFTSYTTGDLIYASGTDTLSKLSGGDTGKVLQMNSSGLPVWGDIDGGTY